MRGYHLGSRCPFCGKNKEELGHILVHCQLVWGLWAAFLFVWNLLGLSCFGKGPTQLLGALSSEKECQTSVGGGSS